MPGSTGPPARSQMQRLTREPGEAIDDFDESLTKLTLAPYIVKAMALIGSNVEAAATCSATS